MAGSLRIGKIAGIDIYIHFFHAPSNASYHTEQVQVTHVTARPFKGEIEAKRTRYIAECEKKRPPMNDLPKGTVTFNFTAIEGSTTRWEQYPEAMRAALARHDALLRSVLHYRCTKQRQV